MLTIDGEADLAPAIARLSNQLPGGAIVLLGAGSITAWAHNLEGALRKLEKSA